MKGKNIDLILLDDLLSVQFLLRAPSNWLMIRRVKISARPVFTDNLY